MDITLLRIATTVVGFVCFLGIVFWVFDRKKHSASMKPPSYLFWMNKDCHE